MPGTRPTLVLAVLLATSGCAKDEPSASHDDDTSSGEESPVSKAKRNVDEGHRDFKEAVAPTADKVDEKTQEVVDEGKRAFKKVTGQDHEDE